MDNDVKAVFIVAILIALVDMGVSIKIKDNAKQEAPPAYINASLDEVLKDCKLVSIDPHNVEFDASGYNVFTYDCKGVRTKVIGEKVNIQ